VKREKNSSLSAAGAIADGTPISDYRGEDYDFAKKAVHSMIEGGNIVIGWVFRNPEETLTLRSRAEMRAAAK